MSQHLHILFTAGCWLKHLLMQIINLLVLVFVRKFKAQRRYTTQLYTVHVYVFVSQLRWMNRKAKWRQRHEIISFDASNSFVWNMSEISVAILKHSEKKWGKKAENYATFNEWEKVFIFRIIAVLPLKLQIKAPEAFSWVEWKIKFAKNLCFASFSKNSKSNMSRMGEMEMDFKHFCNKYLEVKFYLKKIK